MNKDEKNQPESITGYGRWIGLIIAAKAVIILVVLVIILLVKSLS